MVSDSFQSRNENALEDQTCMTIFVTGATGYVGQALVRRLAESGMTVHALYRNKSKTDAIRLPGVRLYQGDLLDPESIKNGMTGCRFVFHAAAKTGIWYKNKEEYYQINVQGTKNVLDCAVELGIVKMVVTSTAGVFGPSAAPVAETRGYAAQFFSDYEKSKSEADCLVQQYTQNKLNAVLIHPTRIYGPGPRGQSNSVTRMIQLYLAGKWHFLLGNGQSRGNYVYIDDVVDGHIAALKKGYSGENYILGGENRSYVEFFNRLSEISPKKHTLIRLPLWSALTLSKIMLPCGEFLKTPPPLTPSVVRKLSTDWMASSRKAETDLGYSPIPLRQGLQKTVLWILSGMDDNSDDAK
jgi:nucleoside-diphosphate-sugar epimerase